MFGQGPHPTSSQTNGILGANTTQYSGVSDIRARLQEVDLYTPEKIEGEEEKGFERFTQYGFGAQECLYEETQEEDSSLYLFEENHRTQMDFIERRPFSPPFKQLS
mmetsp:Transcript_5504/g.4189  ORF Transcript_5504/g.4189 Transcript_5504/m.4189 type:complete len:106 (-) Transcript_5504:56-373(-)